MHDHRLLPIADDHLGTAPDHFLHFFIWPGEGTKFGDVLQTPGGSGFESACPNELTSL